MPDKAIVYPMVDMKDKRKELVALLAVLALVGVVLFNRYGRSRPQEKVMASLDNMVNIEAGHFQMGRETGALDEKPVHEVTLGAFMMDVDEITYREFALFLEDNPEWRKGNVEIDFADLKYLHDWEELTYPPGKDKHPVVFISWFAAKAYAEWAGKTLPTEAQWEYASRGSFRNMDYPWGKDFKPSLTQWYGSKSSGTIQVGRYTINGFGLHDMAGNVSEWTIDGYESYRPEEQTNPSSPLNRHLQVSRGGSWKSQQADLRVSARRACPPNRCLPDLGFRCVFIK